MKYASRLSLLLALGVLTIPTVGQAQGYDYEIVDFPGAINTALYKINESGNVAGRAAFPPGSLPVVYDAKKGTFTTIAPVAGYDRTQIYGIADNGAMVGQVSNPTANTSNSLILDKNGNVTFFTHPDSVEGEVYTGINNRGLVVGTALVPRPNAYYNPKPVGVIYNPKDGSFLDIEPGVHNFARGINNHGDVVGWSENFYGGPCWEEAQYSWLRTADGNFIYFIVNGARTFATAISDTGTVVGYIFNSIEGRSQGFVTKVKITQQCQEISIDEVDLLDVPVSGGIRVNTSPWGITNSGIVSGFYVDRFFGYVPHGFIATPK